LTTFLNKKVEKIKKNVKNVKKRDLNKKRKKTFITSMVFDVFITMTFDNGFPYYGIVLQKVAISGYLYYKPTL